MGGYATWEVLERYGNIFAAGVPLCGFNDANNGAAYKDIPIRIYHGTADPTVSYSSSQNMYNSIVSAGGTKVELLDHANIPDPVAKEFAAMKEKIDALEKELEALKAKKPARKSTKKTTEENN